MTGYWTVCTSVLLKNNWTRGLIDELLGEADEVRPNPHYPGGAPMRLFRVDRVRAAEASVEFLARKGGAGGRPKRGARVDRKAAVAGRIARLPVEVPQLPLDALLGEAGAAYLKDRGLRMAAGFGFTPVDPESDPALARRVAVHFLRRRLTATCVRRLKDWPGGVGEAVAAAMLDAHVLVAVASAYPELAAECEAQLRPQREPAAAGGRE